MLASLQRLNPVAQTALGILAAALLIGILGFAWWTLSPLFLNTVVSEAVTASLSTGDETVTEATLETLLTGSFVDADDFHQTSGTALVLDRGEDRILRLEDFDATNGPDLYVWLVQGENYSENILDLGKLKGNQGAQNYAIPATADLAQYNRVIIWCRAFGVLFGSATLSVPA